MTRFNLISTPQPVTRAAVAAALFALALLAGACLPGEPGTPGIPGSANGSSGTPEATAEAAEHLDDVELLSALQTIGDCAAVLEYLRAETVKRVGPYGLDRDRYGSFGPVFSDMAEGAMDEDAVAVPAAAEESAGSTGSIAGDDTAGFSGTNVQVAGVDEPDIVKTDGNRILAIAQGQLHYVDLTGEQPVYRGSLKLDDSGWGQEILMRGDRALVFSTSFGEDDLGPVAVDEMVGEARIADLAFRGSQSALVQEVDLSDPGAMEVVAELRVEGEYLSARSVGTTAWLAVSSYPLQFEFVHPSGPSAEKAAEEANKQIAATAELGAWLPGYRLDGPGGTRAGLLPDCDRLYTPAEFSGFTVLSVLTFDLEQPLGTGDTASVLADGSTLYGSGESLYLASSAHTRPEPREEGQPAAEESAASDDAGSEWTTTIHKFSVSESGPAEYEASGEVYGHLLNQFSMDEHNGFFRVATTIGEPWSTESSQSQVVVLEQQGRRLTIVGSVGGLGKGERIYSVRYAGDVGYVVTFRQVDPLYVLDLSDPASPAVTGELKIPGFSTYLHPLGDGLLAGIGQQADERGRTQGTKVSLFDVSDPASPEELDVIVFPNGYSEAEWDHRAFLYWAETGLLAIPLNQRETSPPMPLMEGPAAVETTVSSPTEGEPFTGAVALRANRDGIVELGRITHERPTASFPGCRPVADRGVLDEWLSEADALQICPMGAPDEYPGLSCEAWEAEWVQKQWPELDIDNDEKLLICWDWIPRIQRLLIADGDLWTMTERAIQANDLATFTYKDQFELSSSN